MFSFCKQLAKLKSHFARMSIFVTQHLLQLVQLPVSEEAEL